MVFCIENSYTEYFSTFQTVFTPSIQIRISRKYINLINSQMNNRTISKQFTIVRFEPNNILLFHKTTRKTYQYLQPSPQAPLHPQIFHQSLIRPMLYNDGLLYPKAYSNIATELQIRRNGHNVVYFQQEEIVNTFGPLIECLMFLHQNRIVHGEITPTNIVITDEEEIKLKDWMIEQKDNGYYGCKKRTEITQADDLMALGQIIAQTATLRKDIKIFQEKDLTHILGVLVDRYSKGFVLALTIMLKKKKQKFAHLLSYFNNEQACLDDPELNSFYNTLKKEQEKKKIAAVNNQNAVPNTILAVKQIYSLPQSSVQKSSQSNIVNNTPKKVKQDENKKTLKEQTKKKRFKITEKKIQPVGWLVDSRNNEQILKKIAPKPNITVNTSIVQNKKMPKETNTAISPTKRLRASPKKQQ